jgi:hypothetical protein
VVLAVVVVVTDDVVVAVVVSRGRRAHKGGHRSWCTPRWAS